MGTNDREVRVDWLIPPEQACARWPYLREMHFHSRSRWEAPRRAQRPTNAHVVAYAVLSLDVEKAHGNPRGFEYLRRMWVARDSDPYSPEYMPSEGIHTADVTENCRRPS